jgi:O-antigen ligase
LVKSISPITQARHEAALFGTPAALSAWHPLSLYPFATARQLLKVLSYLGAFYLLIYHLNTLPRIRRLLICLLLIGSFEALYGLYGHFSGRPLLAPGRASGTFINANHFAGYLEIVIPLSLSLYMILARRRLFGLPWRQKIVALFDSRRAAPLGLILLGLLVMIVAVIFSISRAGIVSLAASLLIFGLGSLHLRRRRRGLLIILLLISGAFLVGLWEGLAPVEERFVKGPESLLGRYQIWPATWELIRDFPLLGTGLGTFASAFLTYQRESPSLYFDHAHNDYLEILSETGGIGFCVLLGGLLVFVARTLSRLPNSSPREGQIIALGGLSSLIALLLHSLADFNLAITSNVLTLGASLAITHRALHLPENVP